jgi:hypothetical protein
MGLLSWLSTGPKAVDNVLDKDSGLLTQFGGWIGNMNLTDEEVMKANVKTVADVQEFVKATLSESTERSSSRRGFAQMWIKAHLAIIMFCCIAAPFDMELANVYLGLATSAMMGSITGAICIFYFGSQGLARHNETKGKK